MKRRLVDFDSTWKEKAELGPIAVRVLGRDWELPTELPAATALLVTEISKAGGASAVAGRELDLALSLVPKEMLDVWLARGISMPQLGDVLAYLLGEYFQRPIVEANGFT